MAVTERGVSSGYHASGTSQVATFPSGVAVGDFLILLMAGGYQPNVPSGWTTVKSGSGALTVYGVIATKIATSGDVTAGSVTYTIANGYRGAWAVIAIAAGSFNTTTPLVGTWENGTIYLPRTGPALNETAGQRAYYYCSARCDSYSGGGTLNGSRGSVGFQRTSDAYWMSSLYNEDVITTTGSVTSTWSSTVSNNGLFDCSLAINPSAVAPTRICRATIVASRAAQRASRW